MYTQELIDEVRAVYPDSPNLHNMARKGDALLGRYLCDGIPDGFSIDQILTATSLKDLKEKATLYKRQIDLYKEWSKQDPRPKRY